MMRYYNFEHCCALFGCSIVDTVSGSTPWTFSLVLMDVDRGRWTIGCSQEALAKYCAVQDTTADGTAQTSPSR